MTTIIVNPFNITGTLCTSTSLDQTLDEPLVATTASSLASTITSHMNDCPMMLMNNTNKYFDSLTPEELYEMEQKLTDKEYQMSQKRTEIEKTKELIKRF